MGGNPHFMPTEQYFAAQGRDPIRQIAAQFSDSDVATRLSQLQDDLNSWSEEQIEAVYGRDAMAVWRLLDANIPYSDLEQLLPIDPYERAVRYRAWYLTTVTFEQLVEQYPHQTGFVENYRKMLHNLEQWTASQILAVYGQSEETIRELIRSAPYSELQQKLTTDSYQWELVHMSAREFWAEYCTSYPALETVLEFVASAQNDLDMNARLFENKYRPHFTLLMTGTGGGGDTWQSGSPP